MRSLFPASTAELDDIEDRYAPPAGRHVRVGFVQSLDGGVAVQGRSRGLQSRGDLRVFGALRAVCDAVVVGAGTARREGYGGVRLSPVGSAWRSSTGRPPDVPLVVVSTSGGVGLDADRLPPTTVVLTCEAGAASVQLPFEQLVAGGDGVNLAAGLELLAQRGLTRLLCEGGPSLFSSLLENDLVDEVCLTVAPLLTGGQPPLLAAPPTRQWPLCLTSVLEDEGVLLTRWAVERR